MSFTQKIDHPIVRQIALSLLFGVMSYIFGLVNFRVPGLEGSITDLREIPLLISLLYIRNPIYLIISCIITAFGAPLDGSYFSWFFMHLVALTAGWYAFQKIRRPKYNYLKLIGIWTVFILCYYLVFLIPVSLVIGRFLGVNADKEMMSLYLTILPAVRFELISTGLITGFYLVHYNARQALLKHKKNLEGLVKSRTLELAKANEDLKEANKELMTTNAEIKALNSNLDEMVRERTEKVQKQLDQLLKYAFMNSHEVRAPLSRIQGLIPLILAEKSEETKKFMLEQLDTSSKELDNIIKEMNKMLESEILSK